MEVTSIEILSFKILEPVTLLTDVFTATFSLVFFTKLNSEYSESRQEKFWALFFLLFGLSTFLSGLAHGLIEYTGKYFLYFAWIIGCLGVYYMEMASIIIIKKKKISNFISYFVVIKLFISILLIFLFENFLIVTLSSTIGLLGIKMGIRIGNLIRYKNNYDKLIILAIFVSCAPALIHTFHVSFSKWFNHKDISHLILAIAIYIFYKGADSEISHERAFSLKIENSKLISENI